MTLRTSVDGAPDGLLSPHDRGVLYGDALFETLRCVDGRAPLWQRHIARLADGCRRLALPLPDIDALAAECARRCDGIALAVVRMTVTRGIGERGYAPPRDARPTVIVSAAPAPVVPAAWYADGVRLHVCETRYAAPSVLAGVKHANRLEQVLARAEWNDPALAEGLMRDAGDRAISATAANLFARIDGMLATPSVERCGVAGVARAEVLACRDVVVRDIGMDELRRADEVFLTSGVRGIVPVAAIGTTTYDIGATTRALQAHWRERGWMI